MQNRSCVSMNKLFNVTSNQIKYCVLVMRLTKVKVIDASYHCTEWETTSSLVTKLRLCNCIFSWQ